MDRWSEGLTDGRTDRWMNPGQSHLLAPDPGHGKEAPWWQVWAQEGLWLSPLRVWGRQWHPPHGLGETTGGRLSLDLAPGSAPPSCVTLGQWCDLSESCVRGRSQSPGHPLGPPRRVTVPSSKVGFRLPSTAGLHPARLRMAQGRNSEPSCRGRQTRCRHQGPRDEGKGAAGGVPRRNLVS